MSAALVYSLICFVVLSNVYAQLILKWRAGGAGAFPDGAAGRVDFIFGLLLDPWVISAYLAIFAGAICWIAVLARLPLSQAYLFIGASFALVVLLGAYLFNEPLGILRLAGLVLIVVGIVLANSG